jgi:hypothetical protein
MDCPVNVSLEAVEFTFGHDEPRLTEPIPVS